MWLCVVLETQFPTIADFIQCDQADQPTRPAYTIVGTWTLLVYSAINDFWRCFITVFTQFAHNVQEGELR